MNAAWSFAIIAVTSSNDQYLVGFAADRICLEPQNLAFSGTTRAGATQAENYTGPPGGYADSFTTISGKCKWASMGTASLREAKQGASSTM